MKLYENIRARRQELHMTQEELAARMGYKSTSTIAKIEAGKSDIPQSKIFAFATALNTTTGKLMGWVVKDGGSGKLDINKPVEISGEPRLTVGEVSLLAAFEKLNEEGKEKLLGLAYDFCDMPKYTTKKEKGASAS